MAVANVSDVSICNLALQKLGAARITALTDNSRNARSCNNCYTSIRDKELRRHNWNFSIKRAVLAPLATAPAFGYLYAFPVPNDFLKIIMPPQFNLDWKLENQGGVRVILTNQGNVMNLVYVAQITDPMQFDAAFAEAFAAKLAWHMCEEITQSNEKKKDIAAEYKDLIGEASRTDAFEKVSAAQPVDSWLQAQITGSRYDTNVGGSIVGGSDNSGGSS
jgi:hypothetical protein